MALKPNKKHVPLIPENVVLQLRELYFKEQDSYSTLSEKFGYKKEVIKKAVQGIGKYYSGIQDKIPDQVKEARRPARLEYSIKRTKLMYNTKQTVNGRTVDRPMAHSVNWTPEEWDRHRREEEETRKISKEWGYR